MFPLYDENRSGTKPVVNWGIIALNIAIFIYQLTSGRYNALIRDFGAIPIFILNGIRPYTLLTSMFLHGNFWHIAGNMLFLFIFGDNVEDRFGHLKYLALYLLFGSVGGILHSYMALLSGDVKALFIPAIGASGAISGVLGAYLVFFPRAKIITLIIYFYFIKLASIPAVTFIGFWFILQLMYASFGVVLGVAYWAHIGGFLAGVLSAVLAKPLLRKSTPQSFEEYDDFYICQDNL